MSAMTRINLFLDPSISVALIAIMLSGVLISKIAAFFLAVLLIHSLAKERPPKYRRDGKPGKEGL